MVIKSLQHVAIELFTVNYMCTFRWVRQLEYQLISNINEILSTAARIHCKEDNFFLPELFLNKCNIAWDVLFFFLFYIFFNIATVQLNFTLRRLIGQQINFQIYLKNYKYYLFTYKLLSSKSSKEKIHKKLLNLSIFLYLHTELTF